MERINRKTLAVAQAYAEQLALGGSNLSEKVESTVNEYLAKDTDELNTKIDALIEGRA